MASTNRADKAALSLAGLQPSDGRAMTGAYISALMEIKRALEKFNCVVVDVDHCPGAGIVFVKMVCFLAQATQKQ